MKLILCALLSFAATCPSFAQFKPIAESAGFPEPETGAVSVLHLTNGNTVYLHCNFKEGSVELKIFDPSHQAIVSKAVTPSYERGTDKVVKSVFALHGDVVLMIQDYADDIPKLYRFVIDGTTGDLKQQDKVAELEKVTRREWMRIGDDGAGCFPGFYVVKDRTSDHYAVVTVDNLVSDRSKSVEIATYGPDHKEIRRVSCPPALQKYNYLEFLDMTMIDSARVSVLGMAFNSNEHGNRTGELILATLDPGAREASLKELPVAKKIAIIGGRVRYNPVTQKIILLAAFHIGDWAFSNIYHAVTGMIDPFGHPGSGEEAPRDTVLGRDIPQEMYVNADGTYTVVYETETTRLEPGVGNSTYYRNTVLGPVSVVRYNALGVEQGRDMVPKSYFYHNYIFPPFFHTFNQDKVVLLDKEDPYKVFTYLETKQQRYVLFNDDDGIYFQLGVTGSPSKQFLFGRSADNREHHLALCPASDDDTDRNIYAIMELYKDGGSKQAKIVWLQP